MYHFLYAVSIALLKKFCFLSLEKVSIAYICEEKRVCGEHFGTESRLSNVSTSNLSKLSPVFAREQSETVVRRRDSDNECR